MKKLITIALAALSLTALAQTSNRVPEKAVRELCEYMVQVYPQATLQDLYKTCYQDFFGAEHMISDTTAVRAYLHQEYIQALEWSKHNNTDDLPIMEPTGFRHRCMRMFLHYDWSLMDIPEDVIFQSFLQAGKLGPVHDNWSDEWRQIEHIALQSHPEWRNEELQALLHQAASNNQAVHHSAAFREAYHPHYRIVPNK